MQVTELQRAAQDAVGASDDLTAIVQQMVDETATKSASLAVKAMETALKVQQANMAVLKAIGRDAGLNFVRGV